MVRRDIDFDAEGVTLRGWFYTADGSSGPAPDHRHGARLLGRQGDVPRQVRRDVRRGRVQRTRVRQPELRRQRRRTAPGDRPVGAGAGLPPRDHLRDHPARGRRRPDRCLGSSLLRWSRARRRRDRPPGQGRGLASAAGQRARQLPRPGPRRLHRRLPRAVRRRPPLPATRARSRDGAGGRQGPARAVGAADAGLLHLVHRDPRPARTLVAQRGHAAQRRAVHRVRAGRLRPLHQPDAAAADARAERRADPDRPGDRRLRKAREPKKLQILPGGHFDAYVDGFDASGPAARDWFLQHLGG